MKLIKFNKVIAAILCLLVGYSCNKKINSSVPDLKLEESSVTLNESENITVKIVSGNGNYKTAVSPEGIVSALIKEDKGISITALKKGTATITVTDAKDKSAAITVEVKEQSEPAAVTYSQFGAKGDGITDDFDALIKAHEYANQNNMSVKADKGAKYYLGGKKKTITIMTNTNFGDAEFIIDDANVEDRNTRVFLVASKYKWADIPVTMLEKNQKNIGVSLPASGLVMAVNANIKRYIRKGVNANSGADQQEVFLVDKNGNVDGNTPIIWDYNQVTRMRYYRMDEDMLTITGGKFITIANKEPSEYNYYFRGMGIQRSNVVVDGLKHYVTGEGATGAPYNGFLMIEYCTNVTVKNALLTGHKTYYNSAGVSMGSYDFTITRAINIKMENCTQTNDFTDAVYWGIMGSNYCKNLTFDKCILSRFDAHMGVYNATVRNSELRLLSIIGDGIFTLENTIIHGGRIDLRQDYGSTWNGEFIIRNCKFIATTSSGYSLIGGSNDGSHNFGYDCYMPKKITIQNLEVDDSRYPSSKGGVPIFANFNPMKTNESYVEKYPYTVTEEVILSGIKTTSGKALRVSDNTFMFKNVKITRN